MWQSVVLITNYQVQERRGIYIRFVEPSSSFQDAVLQLCLQLWIAACWKYTAYNLPWRMCLCLLDLQTGVCQVLFLHAPLGGACMGCTCPLSAVAKAEHTGRVCQ